jgi:hypothetical protein
MGRIGLEGWIGLDGMGWIGWVGLAWMGWLGLDGFSTKTEGSLSDHVDEHITATRALLVGMPT